MSDVSAVLIVRNEARRVERTLRSLQWANEVVVIDAFSTDDTVAICRRYTDRIFQYAWEGFSAQRQRSVDHARGPWILSVDADEVVTEELKLEIQETVRRSDASAGYWIPRRACYLGRWIEHSGWFPDYQMRLFRKDRVHLEPREVHEGFSVRGETRRLRGLMHHYTYDSIAQHVEKINRYTSLECPEKLRRLGGRKVRWHHLLLNPASRFARTYVARRGYKDGFEGFILALLSAFYTQLLYAKVWLEQRGPDPGAARCENGPRPRELPGVVAARDRDVRGPAR